MEVKIIAEIAETLKQRVTSTTKKIERYELLATSLSSLPAIQTKSSV